MLPFHQLVQSVLESPYSFLFDRDPTTYNLQSYKIARGASLGVLVCLNVEFGEVLNDLFDCVVDKLSVRPADHEIVDIGSTSNIRLITY